MYDDLWEQNLDVSVSAASEPLTYVDIKMRNEFDEDIVLQVDAGK